MIDITTINYKNFGKCLEINNDTMTLIVTIDIGPRIISYSLNGKENVLFEDENRVFFENSSAFCDYFGKDKTWYIYGGHRLWSSPESYPHSYVPDNNPVEYTIDGNRITLIPMETRTGQQHKISILIDETSSEVMLEHEITNISGSIVKLAPWALTVCAPGGVEIVPMCQKDNGLLSNRRTVLWSYSDINDNRFTLTNKYCALRQDCTVQNKFKIGLNNEDGWAAYVNRKQIFVKNFVMNELGDYPDFGCNFETFTNNLFLECESLGELKTLRHGEKVSLTEKWHLIPCEDTFDSKNETEIDNFVNKYIL